MELQLIHSCPYSSHIFFSFSCWLPLMKVNAHNNIRGVRINTDTKLRCYPITASALLLISMTNKALISFSSPFKVVEMWFYESLSMGQLILDGHCTNNNKNNNKKNKVYIYIYIMIPTIWLTCRDSCLAPQTYILKKRKKKKRQQNA